VITPLVRESSCENPLSVEQKRSQNSTLPCVCRVVLSHRQGQLRGLQRDEAVVGPMALDRDRRVVRQRVIALFGHSVLSWSRL
jgi:hypothetical protein